MKYTTLPGTEIRVSVIAMGCWGLAGDGTWGAQSEQDSTAAVRAALDSGINFFDTAPGYGEGVSERRLGRGLVGRRGEAVVATKVGPGSMNSEAVVASVEKSLSDLATDYIDLLQVHWPSRKVPLEETWRAFERLQTQGKVRALGVSNFGSSDLSELLRIGKPSTNQLPYSLLSRALEFQIAPACVKNEVGILCYSPLLWGLLSGKYSEPDSVPEGRARSRHFSCNRPQARHGEAGCEGATFEAIAGLRTIAVRLGVEPADVALAWLLRQPAVTAVLTGSRNGAQSRANARAADICLESDVLAELAGATDAVKQALGSNPDLWQGERDSRFR